MPAPGTTTRSIGGSDILTRLPRHRRREFEALGLVLGMLGILLLVVLTLGSTVPFGP
jgi:hypothetical protein